MKVYTEIQPDYIGSDFTLGEFRETLRTVSEKPGNKKLCLGEKGFDLAGRIYVIWQKIKEFFGFLNRTNQIRVEYEFLKIIYYGAKQHYLKDKEVQKIIKMIHEKCKDKTLPFTQATQKLCAKYLKIDIKDINNQEKRCQLIRHHLEKFHQNHQKALQLGFFHRLFFAKQVEVSDQFQFGDTYLSLAEDAQLKGSVWEIHDINQSLQYYLKAVQLYHSQAHDYTKRLRLSFCQYVKSIRCTNTNIRRTVAKIYLLLTEREFLCKNYTLVEELYTQAEINEPKSIRTSHLEVRLSAALARKDQKAIEKIKKKLFGMDLTDHSKSLLFKACSFMGEDFINRHSRDKKASDGIFSKLGRVFFSNKSTSEPFLKKAFENYQEAWNHATDKDERLTCFTKLLNVFKELSDKSTFRKNYFDSGISALHQDDHLLAAQYFVLSLQFSQVDELFRSKIGKQSLRHVQDAIEKVYTAEAKEYTETMLDHVLEVIKNFKYCFKVQEKKSWFSGVEQQIHCNVPGLVGPNGSFLEDVGAKTYFLKAKIMEEVHPNNKKKICEYYQKAVELAPNNPFGYSALFMIDEQVSAGDDLSKMIETYRNLGKRWLAT